MPFCKQCWGKTSKRPWVDQTIEGKVLDRADEVAELLGNCDEGTKFSEYQHEMELSSPTLTIHRVTFLPEFGHRFG